MVLSVLCIIIHLILTITPLSAVITLHVTDEEQKQRGQVTQFINKQESGFESRQSGSRAKNLTVPGQLLRAHMHSSPGILRPPLISTLSIHPW